MTDAPTWALVVATHERSDVLRRCLRRAAEQQPPPIEIIVTDSSADPSPARAIVAELAAQQPTIRCFLQAAEAPSLPTQRRQGAAAATADVLVMFDDDTLMQPGCAAALLSVYAADTDHEVLGVEATEDHGRAPLSPFKELLIGKLLMTDPATHFVAYDGSFPDLPVPDAVAALGARRRRVMEGFRMTLRREAFDLESPECLLPGAAHMEDYDLSYRVSRHGALVSCPTALVEHLESPDGRRSHEEIVARSLLNQALLLRRHGTNRRAVTVRYRAKGLCRALAGLVKNRWAGRPRRSTWDGVRVGMAAGRRVLSAGDDAVEAAYLREREALLSGFASR